MSKLQSSRQDSNFRLKIAVFFLTKCEVFVNNTKAFSEIRKKLLLLRIEWKRRLKEGISLSIRTRAGSGNPLNFGPDES